MPNMDLTAKIEAVLFWKAEPVSLKKLAEWLGTDVATIKTGLLSLENSLQGRGLTIVETEDEVMLGTAKNLADFIAGLAKEELTKDLGKAGVETLTIILYQGPIARADIDYIRGVNSQFILRALLIRGLIERVENPADARSYLYKPTLALLAHLGVSKIADLPEYESVRQAIETFKQQATPETEGETKPA